MIQIRDYNPNWDEDFVLSTWLRSFRSSHFGQMLDYDDYFLCQRKNCEVLKARCKIWIACPIEYPQQIFGYLIEEDFPEARVLHYAYVKHMYRKMGVFSGLVRHLEPRAKTYYTHFTRTAPTIALKLQAQFQPGLILNTYEHWLKAIDEKKRKKNERSKSHSVLSSR